MSEAPVMRGRGRPRTFDREAVLHKAMLLFWRHGFEGTSMSRLVEELGLATTSLYAAFGDKEALFAAASDLYARGEGGATWRALHEEAHARDSIAAMLRAAAALFTRADRPNACLSVLWGGGEGPASDTLRQGRTRMREAIRARLLRGRDEGDLAADADVEGLTTLYHASLAGFSIEALDGATRADLDAAVDRLLDHWPTART